MNIEAPTLLPPLDEEPKQTASSISVQTQTPVKSRVTQRKTHLIEFLMARKHLQMAAREHLSHCAA